MRPLLGNIMEVIRPPVEVVASVADTIMVNLSALRWCALSLLLPLQAQGIAVSTPLATLSPSQSLPESPSPTQLMADEVGLDRRGANTITTVPARRGICGYGDALPS